MGPWKRWATLSVTWGTRSRAAQEISRATPPAARPAPRSSGTADLGERSVGADGVAVDGGGGFPPRVPRGRGGGVGRRPGRTPPPPREARRPLAPGGGGPDWSVN